jgi:hypothetical protein
LEHERAGVSRPFFGGDASRAAQMSAAAVYSSGLDGIFGRYHFPESQGQTDSALQNAASA